MLLRHLLTHGLSAAAVGQPRIDASPPQHAEAGFDGSGRPAVAVLRTTDATRTRSGALSDRTAETAGRGRAPGDAGSPCKNRRHSLRWFESITRLHLRRCPLAWVTPVCSALCAWAGVGHRVRSSPAGWRRSRTYHGPALPGAARGEVGQQQGFGVWLVVRLQGDLDRSPAAERARSDGPAGGNAAGALRSRVGRYTSGRQTVRRLVFVGGCGRHRPGGAVARAAGARRRDGGRVQDPAGVRFSDPGTRASGWPPTRRRSATAEPWQATQAHGGHGARPHSAPTGPRPRSALHTHAHADERTVDQAILDHADELTVDLVSWPCRVVTASSRRQARERLLVR
jgi:hypothetical protein